MAKVNVPVLVIAFNRPEVLQKLLDRLSENRYRRLYFFVDHERTDLPADKEKVEKCKKMVEETNISDEKFLNFASENLGCGYGPFSAISWAFGSCDELVILEDDCIPSPSFFSYCEELLEKYRDDKRVWMISGSNFSEKRVKLPYSYAFSTFAHFWGWATWKRSWGQVEYDRSRCLTRIEDIPATRFANTGERDFFVAEFTEHFSKPVADIWDYQAALAMALQEGLSIVPQKNLINNIGVSGTHFSSDKPFFNIDVDNSFRVESHPPEVLKDFEYDRVHFEKHWLVMNRRTLLEKLSSRLRKLHKRFLNLNK